jgi:GTPase SAR1 family protein
MRSAMASTFEIRIAILGYVSAGKTTVINALLRDQYGQVGMRRTTAGVNYFRLHHRLPAVGGGDEDPHVADACTAIDSISKADDPGKSAAARPEAKECGSENNKEEEASVWVANNEFVSAARTLDEISMDNVTLRESSFVNAKTFDISITEPLCEVRPDTRLVLVDIPGINEAGADGKYRSYVREHWDTFDCALVVMDGRQGANTEEQVKLLELVRDNKKQKKDIPTIIVCNKVDDPEDEEQAELVKEAKEEVYRIFDVGSPKSLPIFIPTSAEFAYIYRTASLMTFEQFRMFDKERIDRLGRKEVGWKFTKLPMDEKLRLAYQAVTDQSLYADRIRATNFDVLLKWIAMLVGGPKIQLELIQRQMDVALRSLSHEKRFVEKLQDVFEKRRSLDEPIDDLPSHFWATYEKGENSAFDSFDQSPAEVRRLAKPMQDLFDYYEFSTSHVLSDESVQCLSRLKALLLRQIQTILSKGEISNGDWTCRREVQSVQWGTLNPIDWVRVCQSVLLLSSSRVFREEFGLEAMRLENAQHTWMEATSVFGICPKCRHSPLDFNWFCQSCKVLVFPSECVALRGLSNSPVPNAESEKCCHCRRVGRKSGACTRKAKKKTSFGFELRDDVSRIPISLLCSTEGCSQKLNANRLCDHCDVIYCLRGSSRSRHCLFCTSDLEGGSCTMHYCCGRRLTWKELPFASMLEVSETVRHIDGDGNLSIRPKHSDVYRSAVHLDVPASPSDPAHLGHVAWRYCQFVESLLMRD